MALPASLRNVSDLEARLYFALHDVIFLRARGELALHALPSQLVRKRFGRKSGKEEHVPSGPASTRHPRHLSLLLLKIQLGSGPALAHPACSTEAASPPRCPGRRLFQASLHLGAVGALRPVLSSTHPFPSCPGGDPVLSSLAHSSSLSPLQDHPSPPLLTVLYPRH